MDAPCHRRLAAYDQDHLNRGNWNRARRPEGLLWSLETILAPYGRLYRCRSMTSGDIQDRQQNLFASGRGWSTGPSSGSVAGAVPTIPNVDRGEVSNCETSEESGGCGREEGDAVISGCGGVEAMGVGGEHYGRYCARSMERVAVEWLEAVRRDCWRWWSLGLA